MDVTQIILIAICAVFLVVIAIYCISLIVKSKKDSDKKVDGFEVIDGVRYTKDDKVVDDKGEAKLTLKKGDIMLERGKDYVVGKDLLAGKYTILTADENNDVVAIRIGGLVKDYKHFSAVVLTEGDIISPVSANVILR